MPSRAAGLRYPHLRTFLPRTKLAYIHLRNLLTDAKRDRAARVFGYVAIWMPEEVILLYMQEGEVVNATSTVDGVVFEVVPVAEAVARVPTEPELGEATFQEADDEQLACMFQSQVGRAEPWPEELTPSDPRSLFPWLAATTFDGTIELSLDQAASYLIVRDGTVERAFLADEHPGTVVERVKRLFLQEARRAKVAVVRRWPVPAPLPTQVPAALVHAYRDLGQSLVKRLGEHGSESASAVAEHARQQLMAKHPSLAAVAFDARNGLRLPVVDTDTLTSGFAAWTAELLWAATPESTSPEALLRELTKERRHMFQAAGLYDALPWRVSW